MSEQHFDVCATQHRLLGKQVELRLAEDLVLKLSPAEASSLSFALVAVRAGASPEREIYMSPIASDAAFVGAVLESGMSITMPKGTLELDWESVGKLAEKLAEAI
jgi:hypothetical protein